jgi:hypothetical protein
VTATNPWSQIVNPVEQQLPQISLSEGERGVIIVEAVEVEASKGGAICVYHSHKQYRILTSLFRFVSFYFLLF